MAPVRPPESFAEIGQFGSNPLSPDERGARESFAQLWIPTIASLRQRGWSAFNPGSVVELYVSEGSSQVLSRLWISPTQKQLRVRLDAADPVTHRRILAAKEQLRPPFPARVVAAEERLKRAGGTAHVLEVGTVLADLLRDAGGSADMARRIEAFTLFVVDAAERLGRAETAV